MYVAYNGTKLFDGFLTCRTKPIYHNMAARSSFGTVKMSNNIERLLTTHELNDYHKCLISVILDMFDVNMNKCDIGLDEEMCSTILNELCVN